MAQQQIRYETIFGAQAEVLRADQTKFERAMVQIQQSPLVVKPSQRWEPTQDNVDEYLAYCDDICHLVPQDFEELSLLQGPENVVYHLTHSVVKILHAAHAALMCLVTCKIARQHDRVQLAILKRHNELSIHPTPPTTGNCEPPLSKPSGKPRRITAEELRRFRNPSNLHGKQFILSPDRDDDSGMYEVIGYSVARDKMVKYDVLFDDCEDPITVNAKEMMGMLEDSLYLPA